jgi:hypothetical protein
VEWRDQTSSAAVGGFSTLALPRLSNTHSIDLSLLFLLASHVVSELWLPFPLL